MSRQESDIDTREAGGGRRRAQVLEHVCVWPFPVLGDSHMFNTAPGRRGRWWAGAGQGHFPWREG